MSIPCTPLVHGLLGAGQDGEGGIVNFIHFSDLLDFERGRG
ncbi:MAG TPA: hypothetical protein PLV05_07765 [Verrucomicrobiota bacterium]|nr:MAG: hypothetical protein BWX68_01034 [Verrucomicrobia bacterium ADurb.Bin063]HNR70920.1 hypothetical protein [Verrucomicrobiota bacterium]HRR65671.1 hypothetical protein [Candidatus Paceibacterota bacterium]HNS70946.1 hypothetical protein [Verrucomicrobiota bacterium]HNW08559.1 hypothetical protein [Verrucomicrobiota bacterium]